MCSDVSQEMRVALGTRDTSIVVFKYDVCMGLQRVLSVQLENIVPAAIAFADNAAKDVYVFDLLNGEL
jgi:hypothetical protein